MAWEPKKLKEALLPVLIANWISGLSIVEYPLGRPRFLISILYVIILFCAYFYIPITGGFVACDFNAERSPGILLLNGLFGYVAILFILIIITCWYYQESIKVCIRRIELIDETLECLGAKDNLVRIYRQGLCKLAACLFGTLIPFAANLLWYTEFLSFEKSLYCSFRLHAPIYLMAIVDLSFGSIISCIGNSMESINCILENAVNQNLKLEGNFGISRKHHRLIVVIMSAEFNPQTTEKTKNLIQLLKQIHLELSKVAWSVNKIYGLQIGSATLAHIIIIILDAYYTIEVILQITYFERRILVSLICTFSSFWIRFTRMVLINNICGTVAKKAIKAKEIIFELNKGNENTELAEEIEQFAMQISQRPLTFSMCGLFTLEHKFVGSLMTAAVTYLVCLIQIGPKKLNLDINNTTEIPFTTTT